MYKTDNVALGVYVPGEKCRGKVERERCHFLPSRNILLAHTERLGQLRGGWVDCPTRRNGSGNGVVRLIWRKWKIVYFGGVETCANCVVWFARLAYLYCIPGVLNSVLPVAIRR